MFTQPEINNIITSILPIEIEIVKERIDPYTTISLFAILCPTKDPKFQVRIIDSRQLKHVIEVEGINQLLKEYFFTRTSFKCSTPFLLLSEKQLVQKIRDVPNIVIEVVKETYNDLAIPLSKVFSIEVLLNVNSPPRFSIICNGSYSHITYSINTISKCYIMNRNNCIDKLLTNISKFNKTTGIEIGIDMSGEKYDLLQILNSARKTLRLNEIAKIVCKKETTVRNHLKSLLRQGLVTQPMYGYYKSCFISNPDKDKLQMTHNEKGASNNPDLLMIKIYTHEIMGLTLTSIINFATTETDCCSTWSKVTPAIIQNFKYDFVEYAIKQGGFYFNDDLMHIDIANKTKYENIYIRGIRYKIY